MSEEQNANSNAETTTPETAKAETNNTELSKTTDAVAPTQPAGPFGKRLVEAGYTAIQHLGPDASGKEAIGLPHESLLDICRFLKDEAEFDLLLSCAGVDWPKRPADERFESVYHLYSTHHHQYLVLKITARHEHSPSLTPVWPAADWHERETYDLMGIQYDGHPNLSRILMPSDWLGYPLRKDYKVDDPRLVWNER